MIAAEPDQKFPGENELANSQIYDSTYGNKVAPYLQEGAKGQKWDLGQAIFNVNGDKWKNIEPSTLSEADRDRIETQWNAAQKSAIAALGFDPKVMVSTPEKPGTQLSLAGVYTPSQDRIWTYEGSKSNPVHESIHRGIEMLRKNDKLPESVKELFRWGHSEESIVRALMVRHFGDVESGQGNAGGDQVKSGKWLLENKPKALDDLESAAATRIYEQQPRGPH